MATVKVQFAPHLRRFVDVPESVLIEGQTVREILAQLESQFPGFENYIVHENGKLRQHVNLFLDERMIADRELLSDSLDGVKTLYVMQALSGG